MEIPILVMVTMVVDMILLVVEEASVVVVMADMEVDFQCLAVVHLELVVLTSVRPCKLDYTEESVNILT